jgi:DNA-binding CsgD family transcriptional regulator
MAEHRVIVVADTYLAVVEAFQAVLEPRCEVVAMVGLLGQLRQKIVAADPRAVILGPGIGQAGNVMRMVRAIQRGVTRDVRFLVARSPRNRHASSGVLFVREHTPLKELVDTLELGGVRNEAHGGDHHSIEWVTKEVGRLYRLGPSCSRVAAALAVGIATDREIAASLAMNIWTVRDHLATIRNKLGVRARAALAVRLAAGTALPHKLGPLV